jgi:indole-3-glycerol phosphate synthase
MKERYPMPRALLQAKAAEGKYPKRNFFESFSRGKMSGKNKIPVIVSATRASVYNKNSPLSGDVILSTFAQQAEELGAVAVGCHVDSSNFRGSFEDLEELKKSGSLPVICDDFILYGYQIFRAKASGADVIKLMASVLTTQEIVYNSKVAKALGLSVIVVVYSKPQLLDVLDKVPDIGSSSPKTFFFRFFFNLYVFFFIFFLIFILYLFLYFKKYYQFLAEI